MKKKESCCQNISQKTANDFTEKSENNTAVTIPDECKSALIKAMKIGYYKDFYKQGLISAEQLEQLIAIQDKKEIAA